MHFKVHFGTKTVSPFASHPEKSRAKIELFMHFKFRLMHGLNQNNPPSHSPLFAFWFESKFEHWNLLSAHAFTRRRHFANIKSVSHGCNAITINNKQYRYSFLMCTICNRWNTPPKYELRRNVKREFKKRGIHTNRAAAKKPFEADFSGFVLNAIVNFREKW